MLATTHLNLSDASTIESLRAALERWRGRNEGHHHEKRNRDRSPYYAQPIVSLHPKGATEMRFRAWARDLSRSGVCLLLPRKLTAMSSQSTFRNTIDVWGILNVGDELAVGLEKDPDDPIWLVGVVRRLREFQSVALECGVQFVERALGPRA